ncbi:hypothetical protein GQ53DRAFT_746409 [Thozetella sp. PMI_491]|nr:hypothetical protein GQ53DRAFT_746409 [Thozetella sp. PMI_491]
MEFANYITGPGRRADMRDAARGSDPAEPALDPEPPRRVGGPSGPHGRCKSPRRVSDPEECDQEGNDARAASLPGVYFILCFFSFPAGRLHSPLFSLVSPQFPPLRSTSPLSTLPRQQHCF